MLTKVRILHLAKGISLLIGLLMIASVPSFGQRGTSETIAWKGTKLPHRTGV